jgi:2-aminoadipate transaminase
MTLNADVHAKELLQEGRRANLMLTDGRGFFASGRGDNFVRLPFCALTPEEIETAISRLARLIRTFVNSYIRREIAQ